MRRKQLLFGFSIVLLVLGGGLWARRAIHQARAARLVRLMYQAESKTSYAGVVVTKCWDGSCYLTTVAHVVNEYPHRFRITYYSGPHAGFVWATNERESWSLKGTQCTVVPSRFVEAERQAEQKKLDLLLNNYEVMVNPSAERVAKRETMLVVLVPRHAGNLLRKFWVDKKTHLILGREQWDVQNQWLVSSTRYLHVAYKPSLPQQVFHAPRSRAVSASSPEDRVRPATTEEIEREAGVSLRYPQYVPAGYQLDGSYLSYCNCCGRRAAILRYSDGLNTLSVFENHPKYLGRPESLREDRRSSTAPCPACRLGEGNLAKVKFPSLTVAVAGNLPSQELREVARSVPGE